MPELNFFQEAFIFIIIFLLFLPLLARAIRLASTTWDNREDISQEQKQKVFLVVPFSILIAFIFTYVIVLSLYKIIVF